MLLQQLFKTPVCLKSSPPGPQMGTCERIHGYIYAVGILVKSMTHSHTLKHQH